MRAIVHHTRVRQPFLRAAEDMRMQWQFVREHVPNLTALVLDLRLILKEFIVLRFHGFLKAVDLIMWKHHAPRVAASVLLAGLGDE